MSTMGIHFQAEKETPFLINVVCLATMKQRQIHNRDQAAQTDIYDCAIAPWIESLLVGGLELSGT